MAKRGYKVCWWYMGRSNHQTCRTLSAKQHRNAREAAETVLMQNSRAFVTVKSPRGSSRGSVFYSPQRNGRAVKTPTKLLAIVRGFIL